VLISWRVWGTADKTGITRGYSSKIVEKRMLAWTSKDEQWANSKKHLWADL
jgi:hypothetical protein